MKSENINELATALAKAQAKIKGAVKDSTNPHFRSRYAGLESDWEACREALSENGLAVSQVPNVVEGTLVLTTILMHTSGQWVSGDYPVRPVKDDPQSTGSAYKYARRYSLESIVGLYSVEDDDGEGSMHRGGGGEHKPLPARAAGFTKAGTVLQHPTVRGGGAGDDTIPQPNPAKQNVSASKPSSPGGGAATEAGDFVITFGPSKGLRLSQVPNEVLIAHAKKVHSVAEEKKVAPSGESLRFLQALMAYFRVKDEGQLKEILGDGVPF